MALHINNLKTERLAREVAATSGRTLTASVHAALERELEHLRATARRGMAPDERDAWMDAWRKRVGIVPGRDRDWTKAEWDAEWPTGVAEIDNA